MDSEVETSVNVKEQDLSANPRTSPVSSSGQDLNVDISSDNIEAKKDETEAVSVTIPNEAKDDGLSDNPGSSFKSHSTQSSSVNVEGEGKLCSIPRSAAISLSEKDLNVDISCDNTNGIKNEPTEIAENIQENISASADQTVCSETEPENLHREESETISETIPNKTKVLPEIPELERSVEENITANVRVKVESCTEEIDYGMPIAKTPRNTSIIENYGPEKNTGVVGNQNVCKSYTSLALDEYLDGMVTPIAPPLPRLRVKSELSLLKSPQPKTIPENNNVNIDNEIMDTDMCPPPPLLTSSSNSNTDFVADGIATPRISLSSINRLKVKSEFSLLPPTSEHTTEDPSEQFFSDLIVTPKCEKEPGEVSPGVTDDDSDNEIPNDYFDDLLKDEHKRKNDEVENTDLEIKYSERLKELEKLKRKMQEKKERKDRKKQKKSKKKSRKRSRSRSLSPYNSPNRSYRNKRNRNSPLHDEQHSSSNYASRQVPEDNVLKVTTGYLDVKLEYPPNELDNFSRESPPAVEEIEEVLTPQQRKEKATKRTTALLNHLKYKSAEKSSVFCEFPFVSTVRKLPTSVSYVQQRIYENRSPLHTVNNVQYKFNSHSSRFNMEEWGLATLSPTAAKLAKLVGYDAEFIHNKLKNVKIRDKLKKIKQDPDKDVEEEEELVETNSSLYSNAMTQTDDISEFNKQSKENYYEIGVQAQPDVYSIGCQTLEIQSPAKDKHKNDDLPIIKLIEDLNENQLMAVHSFADFIKEPNASSNAMEMYKIQMKIMEIYKMSQIPSALETAQPPIVNNYSSKRPREQSQLCIQSVKSADGRHFTATDPRSMSSAYSKRFVYDEADSAASRYDRYAQPSHAAGRPSTSKGYSQTYYNQTHEYGDRYSNTSPTTSRHYPPNPHSSHMPPTTAKHYGRGGLRR